MDFRPSDDRQMLADTLSRFLADRYPIDVRHRIAESPEGFSADIWRQLADLGVIGALFGEAAGGFGGDGFDIAVVFEGVGKALVVEPLLGTLMAGRALVQAGGHEALLEAAIGGTAILAFAHEEAHSRYDLAAIETVATRDGDGWTLTGAKTVVPQIEAATDVLVSAKDGDEVGLYHVAADAAGVAVRGYPMVDGGRGGELALDGAKATRIATGIGAIEDAIATGIVALAWEAVGLMEALKAATLDYLRTRTQFGVPIGKFQALQHRMATVAIEIEQARSAAINAAAALDAGPHIRDRAGSAAKFTIGRVGTLVAEESVQMHGGIGMTRELPLSHYAKRLTMIGHQLGDEDHHLERYIALGRAA